jgi:hypothetical protein
LFGLLAAVAKQQMKGALTNKYQEYAGQPRCTTNGLRAYQFIVQRAFAPVNQLKELLVDHVMGSGKTLTALGVIILLYLYRGANPKNLGHCLIFQRSENLLKSFITNLHESMKHLNLTPTERKLLEKLIDSHVKVSTFHSVVNKPAPSDSQPIDMVIIDEVHSLHLSTDNEQSEFQTFTEYVENVRRCYPHCKFILLTGTSDGSHHSRIYQTMELLLPDELKFANATGNSNTFGALMTKKRIGTKEWNDLDRIMFDTFNQGANTTHMLKNYYVDLIKTRLLGRISSYHPNTSHGVKIIEMGQTIDVAGCLIKVVKHSLTNLQEKLLDAAAIASGQRTPNKKGRGGGGARKQTQKQLIGLFPTPSASASASSSSSSSPQTSTNINRNIDPLSIVTIEQQNSTIQDSDLKGDALKMNSPLYYYILQQLDEHPHEAAIYYNTLVKDVANILLARVLRLNGYDMVKDDLQKMLKAVEANDGSWIKKRFALMDENLDLIAKIFHHKNNRYGEYLRVLIISNKAAHGYDLTNARQVHIVVQANLALMDQVMFRAIRGRNHFNHEADRYIKVYKHYIDQISKERLKNAMLREKKNKQIRQLLQQCSIDYELFNAEPPQQPNGSVTIAAHSDDGDVTLHDLLFRSFREELNTCQDTLQNFFLTHDSTSITLNHLYQLVKMTSKVLMSDQVFLLSVMHLVIWSDEYITHQGCPLPLHYYEGVLYLATQIQNSPPFIHIIFKDPPLVPNYDISVTQQLIELNSTQTIFQEFLNTCNTNLWQQSIPFGVKMFIFEACWPNMVNPAWCNIQNVVLQWAKGLYVLNCDVLNGIPVHIIRAHRDYTTTNIMNIQSGLRIYVKNTWIDLDMERPTLVRNVVREIVNKNEININQVTLMNIYNSNVGIVIKPDYTGSLRRHLFTKRPANGNTLVTYKRASTIITCEDHHVEKAIGFYKTMADPTLISILEANRKNPLQLSQLLYQLQTKFFGDISTISPVRNS